jgi:hypothetical protein
LFPAGSVAIPNFIKLDRLTGRTWTNIGGDTAWQVMDKPMT